MQIEFKPNTVAPVLCPKHQFFQAWLQFMYPFCKLTAREMEVAAVFISKYLEFCKKIPNDIEFRNKCLLSVETQKEICEICKLKLNQLQLYRNKFKKAGFLLPNNKINPKLIPSIETMQGDKYQLLVVFKFIDDNPDVELQEGVQESI